MRERERERERERKKRLTGNVDENSLVCMCNPPRNEPPPRRPNCVGRGPEKPSPYTTKLVVNPVKLPTSVGSEPEKPIPSMPK